MDRRGFLKGVGIGVGAGTAAALSVGLVRADPTKTKEEPPEKVADPPSSEKPEAVAPIEARLISVSMGLRARSLVEADVEIDGTLPWDVHETVPIDEKGKPCGGILSADFDFDYCFHRTRLRIAFDPVDGRPVVPENWRPDRWPATNQRFGYVETPPIGTLFARMETPV